MQPIIESWDFSNALGKTIYDKFQALGLKIVDVANQAQQQAGEKVTIVSVPPAINLGLIISEMREYITFRIKVDPQIVDHNGYRQIFIGFVDDDRPTWLAIIRISNFIL
jgi:hypothetical protein